jgi:hypothetical protein
MIWAAIILTALGALGLAVVLVGYPLWTALVGVFGARPGRRPDGPSAPLPSISVIVAFRDAGPLIAGKADDLLAWRYPPDRMEVIFMADGPAPPAEVVPAAFHDRGWVLSGTGTARGKNDALNAAVPLARGEVLIFTDVDARCPPEAPARLLAPLADPAVGGVCGRRALHRQGREADGGQAAYIRWDSWIKRVESGRGFLSSNDGKLYAMRRALFRDLPLAVTDDLYNALSVADQGRSMVFCPEAVAVIPKPSRSGRHELARRRRIIARGLNGLLMRPDLLKPWRHGRLAVALLLNKGLRRLMPVNLLLILVGSLLGTVAGEPVFAGLLALQVAGYALALIHPRLPSTRWVGPLRVVSGRAHTFATVNLGTLLGLWDIVRGQVPQQWTPVKRD